MTFRHGMTMAAAALLSVSTAASSENESMTYGKVRSGNGEYYRSSTVLYGTKVEHCNGILKFTLPNTSGQHSVLMDTVMAAKTMDLTMTIFYRVVGKECLINRFIVVYSRGAADS